MTHRFLLPTFAALAGVYLIPLQVNAQSIIAAPDGTNTTVSETAGDFIIENGTTVGSGDQINLFHSFDRFGLITGESATFENSAGATNIIGRVTGGNFSIIDGQISVGSSETGLANLYLLNPAGILFGTNASLNLEGSFSASTATGLAFGNALFSSLGTNNFSGLTGNPTGYVFGTDQASSIVNAGNLALESNQSLTLLGGQVVNSGRLSTSGGQILVAAVEGKNLIRLSQPGSLLSLEFETVPDTFIQSLPAFTPSTLPELLTGAASVGIVTPPVVIPDPFFPGAVIITSPGSFVPIPAATGITDNGDGTFSLSGSPQFVAETGTVVLGGTLESDAIIVVERNIVLDSDLDVSGGLTVEAVQALDFSGDLIIPEGLDSIIFESADSINVGTILSNGNDVDLIAKTSITTGNIDASGIDGGDDVNLTAGTSITTGNINTSSGNGSSGIVVLDAQTSITTGDIDASNGDSGFEPGDVELLAGVSITTGNIDASSEIGDAGNVILDPPGPVIFGSIDTRSVTGAGGDVTITSTQNTVRGIGTIAGSANTIATAGATDDGSITITHGGGDTVPFDVGDASLNGTVGAIATGADTLADGNPNEPFFGSFTAGDIQIIATDILAFDNETICVQDCMTPDTVEIPSGNSIAVNPTDDPEQIFLRLENRLTEEFVEYLRPSLLSSEESSLDKDAISPSVIEQVELGQMPDIVDLPSAQKKLLAVQRATGKKPALIYAVFGINPAAATENNVISMPTAADPLELMLITAAGDPVYVPLQVTREDVLAMAQRLRRQVSTPNRASDGETSYLTAAQQLYQWLVAPLQDQLDAEGIDTISFITDAGLRSTPLAALHDGKDFIIQNYNIGLMPSLSLTDLTYQDLSNVDVLLAGTSTFADQAALPGVPVELASISSKWSNTLLQGDTFVLDTLKGERQKSPSGIIHLATHGEFNVGDLSNSYLYLHNQKLALTQIRTLGLHQPSVELITLSACQTALGNRSAELGFAGFAVLSGAKTSIASLWSVSDEASAGLMIELYRQLQDSQPTIKAEALRAAQLAMIRGDIFVDNDQLKGLGESQQLPTELTIDGQRNFSHPYYWAAFSLVGSPW
ncbi:CHAT domain-containing protein [Leptolyngbya cf. ectocarpi LEGE 11479]|uniref:CHAT domain-containing protein n=1 Tax=Leptolyngbya cf. ectocarpi LEGE 11479 TaxID=1828722 RepID=A0A928X3A5_LEPEC|nr:CHAT domain-containing protein [Leptolyngbya ectocarpi]MBE9066981.1 CHAT domain-containing protein [Leptolyngbya cf. ectocarpi LEGE 11479]